MLPNALPTSLPSPSAFHAAFFGARAADVRRIDLAGGCWMLCGKLAHALQPSEKEVEELWAAKPKEREQFEMYGRAVAVPRDLRLYSQGPLTVRVSNTDFEATDLCKNEDQHPHPSFLHRLLDGVPPAYGYNSVVANWYLDGGDYIGWHGDREKLIDAEGAPILSVSLGSSRRFQVRHEASQRIVFDELLSDGDCVIMGGPRFQHRYKHRVPKMLAKKDGDVGRRINLTVRKYATDGVVKQEPISKPPRSSKPTSKPISKPKRSRPVRSLRSPNRV